MQFKETLNLTTNKKYYYVNGKRVTESLFNLKQRVCRVGGLSYNSSRLETKGNFRYSYCSYD